MQRQQIDLDNTILRLHRKGRNAEQIAQTTGITENKVFHHLTRLLGKDPKPIKSKGGRKVDLMIKK